MTTAAAPQRWLASFQPFRQRGFLLVWTAGLISLAGDWMLRVSLPILVLQLTGSVTATSGVVMASVLPTLLFGGIAGVFVDRWDRRTVMLVGSLAQALAVLPLAAVHGPSTVWIVYATTFTVAGLEQFVTPAESALLPLLVEPDQLVAANSLNAVNNNLARLIGPAIGGIVAAWAGLASVAYVDSGTFVAAVVLLALVRGRYTARASASPTPTTTNQALVPARSGVRNALAGVRDEFLAGLAFIRASRVLAVLLAMFTATAVGEGLMGALFAVYVKDGLHGGVTQVGALMSAQAVGGVAGGVFGGWIGARFSSVRLVVVGATIFGALDVVLFVYPLFRPVFWPAMVLLVMIGVPAVIYGSAAMSLIQAAATDEFRGRVFAVAGTSMGLANLLGAGLAAALGDRFGAMVLLIVQGAGYVIAGVVVGLLLRGSRTTDVTAVRTVAATDHLRAESPDVVPVGRG